MAAIIERKTVKVNGLTINRKNGKVIAVCVHIPQVMYRGLGVVIGDDVTITLAGQKIVIEKKTGEVYPDGQWIGSARSAATPG